MPTLILAGVFAIIFYPLYRKIKSFFGNASVASLVTTFLVLVFILLPLTLIGMQIFQEAKHISSSVVSGSGFWQNIFDYIPKQYLDKGLNWIVGNLGNFFSSVATLAADFFIFLIALYYMFKDGESFKNFILSSSALPDEDTKIITERVTSSINSTIKGSLLVALIQGTLAAFGFVIFGLPNPILWGSVTAISALVPAVGTALVMIPAVLYLAYFGSFYQALGLLIWAALAVGLIDNFLGPKLIGRGIKIHSFLVLLSVVGGLSFFGPTGFIIGPLILSLLYALFEIYNSLGKKTSKKRI